ncbi:hypothetical protein VMCG_04751 [Cytospora schulzeri]|uniref:TNFR-Cys domain-containing protein n=1 Tax=Cytospora schulzeri TaxID=448051 RepID=A0A423WMP2_9PEZI|nr:hypothetical protein VMCG_04751 [Valsa malicola]
MYHSFEAILLFLATLAVASVLEADIIFFSNPGCNRNNDWVYCSEVPPGYCCQAMKPFCTSLSCDHCSDKTLAGFRNTYSCPGLDQADTACNPSTDVSCCLDADDSNTKASSTDQAISEAPTNSTCLTPDGMVYHDAAGVRREIKSMTAEAYQKAMDLYGRGDLEALNGTIMSAQE